MMDAAVQLASTGAWAPADRARCGRSRIACRGVTARPAARQITPPHELARLRDWADTPDPVSRRARQRFERGGGGQLAHRFGGQDPEPGQIAGMITGAVEGGLLGQHMNHHRTAAAFTLGGRRAVGATRTGRPAGLTAPQRPARIGAALVFGARIVLAHRGRQRVQPLVQRRRIGGMQHWPEIPAIPGLVSIDLDIAVVVDLGRHPHPGRVELGHPQIHPIAQLRARQPHPLLGMARDRLIELGQDLASRHCRCG